MSEDKDPRIVAVREYNHMSFESKQTYWKSLSFFQKKIFSNDVRDDEIALSNGDVWKPQKLGFSTLPFN